MTKYILALNSVCIGNKASDAELTENNIIHIKTGGNYERIDIHREDQRKTHHRLRDRNCVLTPINGDLLRRKLKEVSRPGA